VILADTTSPSCPTALLRSTCNNNTILHAFLRGSKKRRGEAVAYLLTRSSEGRDGMGNNEDRYFRADFDAKWALSLAAGLKLSTSTRWDCGSFCTRVRELQTACCSGEQARFQFISALQITPQFCQIHRVQRRSQHRFPLHVGAAHMAVRPQNQQVCVSESRLLARVCLFHSVLNEQTAHRRPQKQSARALCHVSCLGA
jgi:hypothetical protein